NGDDAVAVGDDALTTDFVCGSGSVSFTVSTATLFTPAEGVLEAPGSETRFSCDAMLGFGTGDAGAPSLLVSCQERPPHRYAEPWTVDIHRAPDAGLTAALKLGGDLEPLILPCTRPSE